MESLRYTLDQTPPASVLFLSSLQWFMFILASVLTVPIVLGHAFGMTAQATALLATRTFFVAGIVSLLQAWFGHRYAVLEGPAGMWWGVFIVLIQMTRQVGGSISILQRQLEMGLMIAGLVYMLLAVTKQLDKIRNLFTPVVTGTFLVLLSLQLSKSLVEGLLGIGFHHQHTVQPEIFLLSLALVTFTVGIMVSGRGIVKSLAVLISLVLGWVVYGLLGLLQAPVHKSTLFAIPKVFAWGVPQFHWGTVITAILTAFILLSNVVASVQAFGSATSSTPEPYRYTRGTFISGAGTVLAGLFSTVGMVPLTAASSLVSLTGIASRLPFIIASAAVAILGFFPRIGQYAATLPAPVGYAVLFTVFGQLLGFGLKDFAKLELNQRNIFVVSIPLIAGVGTLFVAGSAWETLPSLASYLLGNGLIVGIVLVLLLEHVLLRARGT
ncbi:purine/pyrimidine permease [Alicyclobacillus sp. SO9]|uniref:purine/pyrimidine permease n=1 Tax=Alicyclobacillus sp. SO9 TaxID=2665646 RepID=UPI0018E7101C|nr:purine/pyrimidine permease [Alicyclobacillus sp. SO9]QQE80358.1 purine/pyrimidine permease [Alicyclobacillus sp. SO9]